jgi:hypothetical protein
VAASGYTEDAGDRAAELALKADDDSVVHLTGAETAAGRKTFSGGIEVGSSTVSAVIDPLGDTQGLWFDATLANGSNPNISLKLRAKGPSGKVETYSALDATEGLYVDGVEVFPGSTTAKPTGAISGGTVGTASLSARSDHRHPGNGWGAVDHALVAWNYPMWACGASQILSAAGTLQVWKVPVDEAALAAAGGVITNVVLAVGSVGVTLTANQCYAGLWLADGTFVGVTADQSTAWLTAGLKSMALVGGPFALTGGAQEVYVGAWYNGTTSPGFTRAGSAPSGLANAGLSSSATYKYATANTGLTTSGSGSVSLGTRTSSNNMIWAAVS